MRRIKNIVNASLANLNRYRLALHGGFPREKTVIFPDSRSVTIPLKNPIYHSKKELINEEKNMGPFVELVPQFTEWLVNFSIPFITSTADDKYPILDAKRDYLNPGPSGFRIYEEDGTYVQIQVAKVPNFETWYQLDYYELLDYGEKTLVSNNAIHKSTILCDVGKSNYTFIDTVYKTTDTKYTPEILTNVFRSVLIYLRPWDYEISSKSLVLTPMAPFSEVK